MKNRWLITNQLDIDLNFVINTNSWSFYSNNKQLLQKGEKANIQILIDGYLLPRKFLFEKYKNFSQYELVEVLYLEYGKNFIEHIKGVFNLIIIDKENFYIFNDKMSINKFFFYKKDEDFIISNDINIIVETVKPELDIYSIAISTLFHRYLEGKTAFKSINYSQSAQNINFKKELYIGNYWSFDKLLENKQKEVSAENFADEFSSIIKQYNDYLKPNQVSQTLTGGLDSRTILAGLLNNSIKPDAYTYGSPNSKDVVFAKKVTDEIKMKYKNHYPKSITSDWFNEYANEILNYGNSVCSIHRAHRLDCIKNSIESEDEMLIGGYMGNETLRGLSYDDLIISEFLRLWWTSEEDKRELIKNTLNQYFFNLDLIDIDKLYKIISKFNFIKNSMKLNHFYATFEIKATNHHNQDPYLFLNYIKYPVPIFMDDDLLKFIFSSKQNIMNIKKNENIFTRVKSHEFNLKIIRHLAPELNNIPFGKNGYYTINEYFSNRVLFYLKRFTRNKCSIKYPSNFTLGTWMHEFVTNSISKIDEDTILTQLFDIDKMEKMLIKESSTKEKDWIKYSNIISLYKINRRK